MLAIIEVLLESILGFILELILEGIVYGIQVSTDGGAQWSDAGAPGSPGRILTDNADQLVVELGTGYASGLMRISVDIPVGL